MPRIYKKRIVHSKKDIAILNQWVADETNPLYIDLMSQKDFDNLCEKSGLNEDQVDNWLKNKRAELRKENPNDARFKRKETRPQNPSPYPGVEVLKNFVVKQKPEKRKPAPIEEVIVIESSSDDENPTLEQTTNSNIDQRSTFGGISRNTIVLDKLVFFNQPENLKQPEKQPSGLPQKSSEKSSVQKRS